MRSRPHSPASPVVRGAARRGTVTDIPHLFAIMSAARENRQFETQESFASAIAPFLEANLCWAWTTGPIIDGFVVVDGRQGSVEMLYVDPAAEGRRIGRRLMRHALDDLVRAGHRTVFLVTARETRAERFYRAQGWDDMGDTGRGSVRMVKRLR